MLVLNWKRLVNGEFTNKSMLIDNVNEELLPSSVAAAIKLVNSNPSVAILSTWDGTKTFKEFDIPKRKEGYRHIKAPVGVYKYSQAFAMRYLRDKVRLAESEFAYGFVRHKTCKGAVSLHQQNGSNWFLKLDIKDFFPSISKDMIINAFKQNANSSLLSEEVMDKFADLFTDETGHLTQGCISSPYIANVVLSMFDAQIYQYCYKHHIIYTRYADDMCFSSVRTFDYWELIGEVLKLLPEGLNLNREKTTYKSKAGSCIILGIHYNAEGNLTVGYRKKHELKVIAHKWDELSWEERGHWIGMKTYYKTIEPEYFSKPCFDIISWENR